MVRSTCWRLQYVEDHRPTFSRIARIRPWNSGHFIGEVGQDSPSFDSECIMSYRSRATHFASNQVSLREFAVAIAWWLFGDTTCHTANGQRLVCLHAIPVEKAVLIPGWRVRWDFVRLLACWNACWWRSPTLVVGFGCQ